MQKLMLKILFFKPAFKNCLLKKRKRFQMYFWIPHGLSIIFRKQIIIIPSDVTKLYEFSHPTPHCLKIPKFDLNPQPRQEQSSYKWDHWNCSQILNISLSIGHWEEIHCHRCSIPVYLKLCRQRMNMFLWA